MTYTATDSAGSASQSAKECHWATLQHQLRIAAAGSPLDSTPPDSCSEIIALEQLQPLHPSSEGEQQILIDLPTGIELSECFDRHAVMLTAVEGQASLVLAQNRILLEPGVLVWVPAHTLFTLQPQTSFIGLLNLAPQSDTDASIWVIHL